ncbi:MAG: hypothetical protein SFZ02_18760 [bacterium]|nr:hypothetical protein [bacterium]
MQNNHRDGILRLYKGNKGAYIRALIILLLMMLGACATPTPEVLIIPNLDPSQTVSATDFQGRVMRLSYPESWLARVGNKGEIVLANRQNALGAWDINIFSLRAGEMAGVIAAIDEESIENSWERNLETMMSRSRAEMTGYQDMRAQFTGNEAFTINGRDGLITNGTLTRDELVVEVVIIVVYDEEDGGYASMILGASVGEMRLFEPLLMEIAGTFDFIRQS